MNMVLNFHAGVPVRSLYRAYQCENCGTSAKVHLVEGKDYSFGTVPEIPKKACDRCGSETQPSESDEEFFQFLVA